MRGAHCFVLQAVRLLTKETIQTRMALSVEGNFQHFNRDRGRSWVSELSVDNEQLEMFNTRGICSSCVTSI